MTPLDRTAPPPPAPLRPHRFPDFERHALGNGLQVLLARLPRLPLASLTLLVPAGAERDGDRPGLATLHGSLLDEGTRSRSALEIAGAVERLGGSLGSGAGWDALSVSSEVLAAHAGEAVALIAEVAREATFPAAEIERLRQVRLAELLRRRDQPAALAEDAFARVVYRGSPYGHSLLGDRASVEALDRDAFLAFYRRHVGPGGATLVAVGDLEPAAFLADVEAAFGDWPASELAQAPAIDPPAVAGPVVHVVDRPGAVQTQLLVGHRGVPRSAPGHPERVVLNAIVGGKFTSRINLNLRERHGYTYGASSRFSARRGPGPFSIRTAVGSEVAGAAVREILGELELIRREPPSREEVDETRRYLVGVFPYTLQTVGDLAQRLEDLVVHRLGDDYYDGYPAVLARVEPEDVLAAARRHLLVDQLVVVAVGPGPSLAEQLAPVGPVTVVKV